MEDTAYPKINGVYMRDERGNFIDGEWAQPEFGYLAELDWHWTEKVDGTNIRLILTAEELDRRLKNYEIRGRTDRAQIPAQLLETIAAMFDAWRECGPDDENWPGAVFDEFDYQTPVVLYGEGYGPGIQKGGGLYRDTQDFVLFDVKVGNWWLKREDVIDVAVKLNLNVVPTRLIGSLNSAIELVKHPDFDSNWYGARPEGLVGRPLNDLCDRAGRRITTKVKVKDFR